MLLRLQLGGGQWEGEDLGYMAHSGGDYQGKSVVVGVYTASHTLMNQHRDHSGQNQKGMQPRPVHREPLLSARPRVPKVPQFLTIAPPTAGQELNT